MDTQKQVRSACTHSLILSPARPSTNVRTKHSLFFARPLLHSLTRLGTSLYSYLVRVLALLTVSPTHSLSRSLLKVLPDFRVSFSFWWDIAMGVSTGP